MPFSVAGADYMLTQGTSGYGAYGSLHTAYSATGGSEVSGGSYAREALTWASASANSIALASAPTAFSVPASTTVAYVGFWSALTSGNFLGMGPIGAGSQYVFTCPVASPGVFTAIGSSYSNNTIVTIFPVIGESIPTGFTAGNQYYVVNVSGATFQLSATSGGGGINATGAGAGIVVSYAPESFGSAGTLTLTTSTTLYLY